MCCNGLNVCAAFVWQGEERLLLLLLLYNNLFLSSFVISGGTHRLRGKKGLRMMTYPWAWDVGMK